jgi:2-dehydropantoate 2-reductase
MAGGHKAPVEPDLRNDIWVKLMGNVAFNPLSALTRATMAQMCEHDDTRALVATMMTETLAIARAAGSDPGVSVEKRIDGAWRVGHHKTSMLQDLEAGKPLEIDAIIGAVVELAGLTGVPAPALRHVHAAISLLDHTSNPPVPVGAH